MRITSGPIKYVHVNVDFVCGKCGAEFTAEPWEYEEAGFWRMYFMDYMTQCKCLVCGRIAYSMDDGVAVTHDGKMDYAVEVKKK